MKADPTLRFSSRVENYVKYRPGYPPAIIDALVTEGALSGNSIVADIGSGTGILAEMFLKSGNPVFGVEPNREMREAGERFLKQYPGFTSVNGTAEATALAPRSVDLITAGQSFHWFDRHRSKTEFARILKPNGWVALIWNDRDTDSTPFLREYEQLLKKFGTDYAAVNHRNVNSAVIKSFFAPQPCTLKKFENHQHFDFDSLKGRLLSSSYVPEPGHPTYQPMLDALRVLFDKHQVAGQVDTVYTTLMYCGKLA